MRKTTTIKAIALIVIGVGLIVAKAVLGWPSLSDLRGSPRNPTELVLGRSAIEVPRRALVGVQVDRVVRDIAWTDSRWDRRVPADRTPTKPEDLVPYMEGRLVGELMRFAKVKVQPLGPVTVRRNPEDGLWYAPDAEGRYRFEIDGSKVAFESVRPLGPDQAQMPDTHGFNSIAAAAVRARPFLVVGCMDLPSKADAALYLAERRIHAYGPEDRFSYRLLGYRMHKPEAAMIVGSAPIRAGRRGSAVIGGQPVTIRLDEPIVVQWTDRAYPWQYSDAPWRYFSTLNERYFLNLRLIRVHADAGRLDELLATARKHEVRVVAVRVGKATSDREAERDAAVLAAWLTEDSRHRAVLFHTAPYEPGYALFFKFPKQTTFGDLDPLIR